MGDFISGDDWLVNRRISNVMGSDDIYDSVSYATRSSGKFPLKTYYVYSRGCSEPTRIRAESKDAIRKNWEDKEHPITFINED